VDTENTKHRAEGEVFIRQDMHRLFAVLKVADNEYVERLPLQIQKYSDGTRRWWLEKVADRLMKMAGIKKAKTLSPTRIITKDKPLN